MWNKPHAKNLLEVSSGIEVSLKELIDLRLKAQQPVTNANKRLNHAGQKLSRVRGRGMEFDTTREYQAGDDIHHMAWRVTARSLKPHIKVYHEEKERPVWLAVDLSPSLYFGTRSMFKSVCSLKQAAFLGWSRLLKREQIGAMIATESKPQVFRPQASERNFLTILKSFAANSANQPAFNDNNYLYTLLSALQQQVRAGNSIIIFSDFFHFDNDIQKLILHMAQFSQVELMFVYDPFEAEAPNPHQYVLTNGQREITFNMDNLQNRAEYQAQFQLKQNNLMAFARKHNIALQILRTDQAGMSYS